MSEKFIQDYDPIEVQTIPLVELCRIYNIYAEYFRERTKEKFHCSKQEAIALILEMEDRYVLYTSRVKRQGRNPERIEVYFETAAEKKEATEAAIAAAIAVENQKKLADNKKIAVENQKKLADNKKRKKKSHFEGMLLIWRDTNSNPHKTGTAIHDAMQSIIEAGNAGLTYEKWMMTFSGHIRSLRRHVSSGRIEIEKQLPRKPIREQQHPSRITRPRNPI
jgi:hypothetical protein